MFPLLPFAAGILTGAAAIKLIKANRAKDALDKTRSTLDKVQTGLRNATVSGLTIVESSSATLRSKLTTPSGDAVQPTETPETVAPSSPAPEVAPAAPKTTRRKPAAKAGEAAAAPRARRRKPEGEAS